MPKTTDAVKEKKKDKTKTTPATGGVTKPDGAKKGKGGGEKTLNAKQMKEITAALSVDTIDGLSKLLSGFRKQNVLAEEVKGKKAATKEGKK